MESLSQGDSSANSSDPDDELGPADINQIRSSPILGRMTGKQEAKLLLVCRPSESSTVVAHLDILGEALYCHLECLPKNRENASGCCKARWIF
jgi:hypothetical protein